MATVDTFFVTLIIVISCAECDKLSGITWVEWSKLFDAFLDVKLHRIKTISSTELNFQRRSYRDGRDSFLSAAVNIGVK